MPAENYDAHALLALPKIAPQAAAEKGLLSWSRPYLIERIRSQGVDVSVTRGITSLTTEPGVAKNVSRPDYQDDNRQVEITQKGDVELDRYGVLRNILANTPLDEHVTILNSTAVRTLIRNKHETIQSILQPVDVYDRHAQLFDPMQPNYEVLDSVKGDLVVAKPNTGSRSRGVMIGNRQSIKEQLQDAESLYIVEEKIDFSHPFPDTLRGYDENEQRRLDEANRDGVNKELRMFYFGKNEWETTARVARPGEANFSDDKWLYIDETTIPEEIHTMSGKIIDRLARYTGDDEMNIAIDFVYGSTASDSHPRWQVMELNGAEPQLVQLTQHFEIGSRQHIKLAHQIARIALMNKT